MAFTPGANYTLAQIDVALQYEGGTNSVTLRLDDSVGGVSGSALLTWSLSGIPAAARCPPTTTVPTVIPEAEINLFAGTQYWVVVGPGQSDTVVDWDYNSIGATGYAAFNQGSGWNAGLTPRPQFSAFDVQGTPEPETDLRAHCLA